jgi:predicted ATPase/DNA-binding winged helix-turn-helix (wHTH) protein
VAERGLGIVYESGQWQVHLGRRELLAGGVAVPIGARAFEIVEVLVQSANDLVTKNDLMDRVWPGATVEENTLQVHISAIRRAFGPDRDMLKTLSGRGYRLSGSWTARQRASATEPFVPPLMRDPRPPQADNFPRITGHLIGRAAAARQVRDLISAYRVVTLAGPGGIGKTSLAVEAARGLLAHFDGGGWFVELASLSNPDLVPSTIASALGLKLNSEISAESVAHAIGAKHVLLVLDNCEHVIDAVASFVESFVSLCPRATILVTSREVLRVSGECVYRVPPLEVPAMDEKDADDILRRGAVELFVARAKASDSDFFPHAETLPAIGAICRHLDGIPLAIEFAAAHAAMLGVPQVTADLRDRFALLTRGRRTALPRHRTLRAVLDWSHELLTGAEQLLLRRLAIFPAGFTIEAVAAVMSDSGLGVAAVTDGIANLVAKSLVMLDTSAIGTRWYLLETTRAYALDKLARHGETESTAWCHAAYFRDVFASPGSGFKARLSKEDLIRQSREIDNVRAALDWAFSVGGDETIGIDLTAAYAPVWMSTSLMAECCERCERALGSLEPSLRLKTWSEMWLRIALGSALITIMGPSERARLVLIRALQIADDLNDLDAQARALSALATVLAQRGEYAEAHAAVGRLSHIAQSIGDPAILIVADRSLGTMLLTAGRPREAQFYVERVLRSAAVPDDQRRSTWRHSDHRAMARAVLARALWLQGLIDDAHAEARRSLEELHGSGHTLSICRVLYYGVCRITPMTGDFRAADQAITRLIEVATGLNAPFWKTAGHFLEGKLLLQRGDHTRALSVLRDAFETCRRTGWRMSYPEFKAAIATSLAGLGQLDEALEAVDEGIAGAGQPDNGQRWYLPELLRVRGEVLLRQNPAFTAIAEDCFTQASDMACEQGALFWELRVAISLARLRVTQGRFGEARQILVPVHGRFTEGFATTDLQAARSVLDGLPI